MPAAIRGLSQGPAADVAALRAVRGAPLPARAARLSVRAPHALSWDAAQLDERADALLPGMNIDVLLESRDRVIVIDTKFYREALQMGPYRQTFRSENLYQLFAYLKNLEHRGGAFARCEGMLLYPTVEHEIDSRFELQGHPVRVRTIDLGRDWREIHEAMLGMIGPAPKIAAGGSSPAASRAPVSA